MNCDCGERVTHPFHQPGCVECGQPCCPTCAISLESATDCRDCASDVLGAAALTPQPPFEII